MSGQHAGNHCNIGTSVCSYIQKDAHKHLYRNVDSASLQSIVIKSIEISQVTFPDGCQIGPAHPPTLEFVFFASEMFIIPLNNLNAEKICCLSKIIGGQLYIQLGFQLLKLLHIIPHDKYIFKIANYGYSLADKYTRAACNSHSAIYEIMRQQTVLCTQ